MIQLIYASVATKSLNEAEIEDLRLQSCENNKRDEITGMIITRGDRFLQALEGPQVTVENTFLRIIVDPRHHSLAVLSRRLISRREYGEWEMLHSETIADCASTAGRFTAVLARASDDIRAAFLDPVRPASAQAATSSASSP